MAAIGYQIYASYLVQLGPGGPSTSSKKPSTSSGNWFIKTSSGAPLRTVALFSEQEPLYIDDSINKWRRVFTVGDFPRSLPNGVFWDMTSHSIRYSQWIELGDSRIEFDGEDPGMDYPQDGIRIQSDLTNPAYTHVVNFSAPVNMIDARGLEFKWGAYKFIVDNRTNASQIVLRSLWGSPDDILWFENGEPLREGPFQRPFDDWFLSAVEFGGTPAALSSIRLKIAPLSDAFASVRGIFQTNGSFDDGLIPTNIYYSYRGLEGYEYGYANESIPFPSDNRGYDTIEHEVQNSPGAFGVEFHDQNNELYADIRWIDELSGLPPRLSAGYDLIKVIEMVDVKRNEFAVVGDYKKGWLLKVMEIRNSTIGYEDDEIIFQDEFDRQNGSYTQYRATITSEGRATLVLGERIYDILYTANPQMPDDAFVRINFPISSNLGEGAFYPILETRAGAKIMLYQPTPMNLNTLPAFYGGQVGGALRILLPDGGMAGRDVINFQPEGTSGVYNVDTPSGVFTLDTRLATSRVQFDVGRLHWEVRGTGTLHRASIFLADVNRTIINHPAMVVFEAESDLEQNDAFIVIPEFDEDWGIKEIQMTWEDNTRFSGVRDESGRRVYGMDRFGSLYELTYEPGFFGFGGIVYSPPQARAQAYLVEYQ